MVVKRRPLPAPAVPAPGAPPDDHSLAWGGLWLASRMSRRHRRQRLPQRGHDGEGALGKGAGEEERESSASSSSVSPSSAMAVARSEAKKRGREWRGRASARVQLPQNDTRRQGRGHAEGTRQQLTTMAGRGGEQLAHRGPRGVARRCMVGHDAAFAEGVQKLKKQILPQTYKLKPIFRTSLTPKPRRVGKNSTNKSCRSTYHLQLYFGVFV